MKIDFHTHYVEREFEGFCGKARQLGLDALVMEGLPENKDFEINGLKIFPAQEVEWKAALEIPRYNEKSDYADKDKADSIETQIFKGKSLVLLPLKVPFLDGEELRLYSLLEEVSKLGGVTISLQNNENWSITGAIENYQKVYSFDAVRIRPHNSHDINSELPLALVAVAGSDAYSKNDLGKAYTSYASPIQTQNDLIKAIKDKSPTSLFVHPQTRIEDTVAPLKFNFENVVCKSRING